MKQLLIWQPDKHQTKANEAVHAPPLVLPLVLPLLFLVFLTYTVSRVYLAVLVILMDRAINMAYSFIHLLKQKSEKQSRLEPFLTVRLDSNQPIRGSLIQVFPVFTRAFAF